VTLTKRAGGGSGATAIQGVKPGGPQVGIALGLPPTGSAAA